MMAVVTFIPLFIEMRTVYPGSFRAYSLANSFLYLHQHIWPAAVMIMLAVCIHALFFSHRIAGPMYRFKQVFLSLKAGKVPGPQRLRKSDFLKAEMKLINEMLDSLQSKTIHLQETQKAIADSIAAIAQRSRALSDRELALLVEDLDDKGKRLAEDILLIEKEP